MSEQSTNLTIEDQINDGLSGDARKNALSFAAFLRANGFVPEVNNEHDGWNILNGDKVIVFLKVIGEENVFAIVFNYYFDFDSDGPVDDDVKEFTWAHVVKCPNGCGGTTICEMSQKHKTIFGREYQNVCVAPLECFNLDSDELELAEKLMLMGW